MLNKTVGAYRKSLQLTRNQYASGVASYSDVLQAQSLLESAEAQAINNGILRGQYEHAIAVLIGKTPAALQLSFMPLKVKPPIIPVTIPTAWLERRPDVAQAERLMKAANASIGIAIAAYYPTLDLSATISAAGQSLKQLIQSPTIGWSYGGQLAETIFDGGLRDATVCAAKAAYRAQVANYRQTVLSAFQDVEDNLIALRLLREQRKVLQHAASDAEKALKIIINQYKAGTVNYLSVLTSQVNLFNAQKTALDTLGLEMSAAVTLIKALGGGWCVDTIVPA